jgi:hypothetical protein
MRHIIKLVVASMLFAVIGSSAAFAANGDCRLIRGADTPNDPTDDVSVCRQDTWIHQASLKPGNLAATGNDAYPSWNTTAPTQSAQQGAGGGYLANSVAHQLVEQNDPHASATFAGHYTGTLDDLAVELYAFVSPIQTGDLDIGLLVDGQDVYQGDVVPVKMVTTSTQQLVTYRFAFTNLYKALEDNGTANSATTAHSITLAVSGTYVVDDNTLFVYDTSEVPSGLIFNLEPGGLTPYTSIDISPEE